MPANIGNLDKSKNILTLSSFVALVHDVLKLPLNLVSVRCVSKLVVS